MIEHIKAIYRLQMFFPGWLGVFVNPFYFARSGLCDAIIKLAPMLSGRLLDVGCGTKPYQSLFAVDTYIGLDIDGEESRKRGVADYYYDGNAFPFPDTVFDSILCNQVLEHVFNPNEFLGEIARVLRPEGKLLLTVPFVWEEHSQPYDFARYSSFGLCSLLERSGFDVIEQRKTNADVRVLFQLVNAYLFKVLLTSNAKVNLIICAIVMGPVTLLGIMLGKVIPANPDLYLDQVILAKRRAK